MNYFDSIPFKCLCQRFNSPVRAASGTWLVRVIHPGSDRPDSAGAARVLTNQVSGLSLG